MAKNHLCDIKSLTFQGKIRHNNAVSKVSRFFRKKQNELMVTEIRTVLPVGGGGWWGGDKGSCVHWGDTYPRVRTFVKTHQSVHSDRWISPYVKFSWVVRGFMSLKSPFVIADGVWKCWSVSSAPGCLGDGEAGWGLTLCSVLLPGWMSPDRARTNPAARVSSCPALGMSSGRGANLSLGSVQTGMLGITLDPSVYSYPFAHKTFLFPAKH